MRGTEQQCCCYERGDMTMTKVGDNRDYEVGYGKPPENTRWQKGESGNPKGRPKGSKSFATVLEEELNRKIAVTQKGKTKRITFKRAIARQAVQTALVDKDLMPLTKLGAFRESPEASRRKSLEDDFVDYRCTLEFEGEPQLTYYRGKVIKDHRLDRADEQDDW